MGGLRPHLRLAAVLIVTLQIATPAFASAALCCKDPAALAGNTADLMECCKKGGAHICPMKPTGGSKAATKNDHSMRSCCKPDAKIFLALLGAAGVLAQPTPVLTPPTAVDRDARELSSTPIWIAVAASPPPKA